MQKCLVFSDSHGAALLRMQRVIEAHTDAQVVFFLGDGLSEAEALVPMFPDRAFLFVRGNCDLAPLSAVEETDAVTLEGVRIVFTHGHKYGVKYDLYNLQQAARQWQADVVLFGHTHTPYEAYEEGMYFLNPGSLGYEESYGYVDVTPAGILTGTARLPR